MDGEVKASTIRFIESLAIEVGNDLLLNCCSFRESKWVNCRVNYLKNFLWCSCICGVVSIGFGRLYCPKYTSTSGDPIRQADHTVISKSIQGKLKLDAI